MCDLQTRAFQEMTYQNPFTSVCETKKNLFVKGQNIF